MWVPSYKCTEKHLQLRSFYFVCIGVVSVGDAYFGEGSGPVLGSISCTGTEHNVTECGTGSVGRLNCHHGRDVGVICQGITDI